MSYFSGLEALNAYYPHLIMNNEASSKNEGDGDEAQGSPNQVKHLTFEDWKKLKRKVPSECKDLMDRAEKLCLKTFPSQKLSQNVTFLVHELIRTLPSANTVADDRKDTLVVMPFETQGRSDQNEALKEVWKHELMAKLQAQKAFYIVEDGQITGFYVPLGHQEIREWLDSPENEKFVREVKTVSIKKRLKALPDEIGRFVGLTRLTLSRNELTRIPDSIWNLSKLTKLSLHHNRLKEIPDGIGNLRQLRKLYLQNNQLKEIPESIGNLSRLATLDLRCNRIEELPKAIDHLARLVKLYL
ncbi:MAG: leucine-rich repeat domain-containing protein [Verrucomicrobia bacterium]|nr:leucine-rich repeat domain-containing protein [Verrucomicrobiota bacterium]